MEFGICGGAWNQYPTDTQRQLKVWGSQKLHLDFRLYWGSVLLTPMLFKGQLYLDPQLRQNSRLKFLFRKNREISAATNPSHLLRLKPQLSTVEGTHVRAVVRPGRSLPEQGRDSLCGNPPGFSESKP